MREMESERALKGSFYTIKDDFYKWIGTFITLTIVWILTQKYSLDYKTSIFFVITIFAILLWCFSLIPDAITGLLLPTLYVIFKVSSPAVAFKAWTSTIPWLVLAAMLISTMLNETGVARRIGIWSIAKFGKTFSTILLGITLAGIIITPFIPSVIAKIIIFNIITIGLIETLGYKPKSLEATLIIMAGFFVISTFRLGFATGDSGIIIGLNYAQQVTGSVLTWTQYLIHNLPYVLFYTFGSLGILILFSKNTKPLTKEKIELLQEKYLDLGKIKNQEKKAFLMMGFALLLMSTESIHKINSAWILIVLSSLFFIPKIDLLNNDSLKKINLFSLLFIVGAMSIGSVASETQAINIIKNLLQPFFSGSIFSIITVSYISGILLNFLLTPLAAMSSFTIPLIQLGIENNINPYIMTYIFQISLDQYLLPYEFAGLLLVYTSGYVSLKTLVQILIVRMGFGLIVLLGIAYPWWNILGIISN
ncbi:SLC13 family permease [uncultured Cetobacterium sp.]|uniref:SLC13 family permease n=1 Tax=uncultured Cetobacterium sp. TaxID=527638 RepID=UPI00261E736C|nr:SLC13 family permease [uncultured Cetobacterium sp.]